MPTEWGDDESSGPDAVDYEELRRQLMASAGSGAPPVSGAPASPENQPAPATMASSGPQSGSVGDIIARSAQPVEVRLPKVYPPAVRSRLMASAGDAVTPAPLPPAGTAVAQPAPVSDPASTPQPPSVGSIIAGEGGPRPPTAAVKTSPLPSEIPQPGNNNLLSLISRRAQAGQPINPAAVDPQTGKPMYRMGLGQRLLGTLANFAMGFGSRGGAEPIYVGPGATNARFARDKSLQQENVSNLDTEIGNTEKLNTEQQNLYNAAMKSAYETQLGEAREKTAEAAEGRANAAGENAAIRGQLVQSQNDLREAQAKKDLQPKQPSNEVELVQAYNTEADPKKKAALKGAIDQLAALKAAGKDTSAADLAKIIAIQNQKSNMLDRVAKEKESERARLYKEADSNLKLKYNADALAAERQKIDANLDAKYAPREQQASDEADKLLGLTKKGGALQSKSGNTPASTPSQPPPAGAIPAKPTTPPKPGKVWVYDKKTGTRGQIPQSQLKQATQSGQYGTW